MEKKGAEYSAPKLKPVFWELFKYRTRMLAASIYSSMVAFTQYANFSVIPNGDCVLFVEFRAVICDAHFINHKTLLSKGKQLQDKNIAIFSDGQVKYYTMLEKQKQILNTLASVLPNMSDEKQSYLLGFGEGMAVMQKKEDANKNASDKRKKRK